MCKIVGSHHHASTLSITYNFNNLKIDWLVFKVVSTVFQQFENKKHLTEPPPPNFINNFLSIILQNNGI